MKNNLLIISTAIFCFNLNASDTITLKNRKVIHAYIIEKSDTKIKYRTDSINNVESTNNMKLGRIRTIHYNNGDVDLLSSRSPRNVFPLGIDVGANFFLYGILLNGSIDYMFTPNISAEFNHRRMLTNYYPAASLFSIGGKYWLANKYSKSGFSPNIGLFFTRMKYMNDEERILDFHEPKWLVKYFPELPIGISYISKFGLQSSFQMSLPFFCMEYRIGWRFKTGK